MRRPRSGGRSRPERSSRTGGSRPAPPRAGRRRPRRRPRRTPPRRQPLGGDVGQRAGDRRRRRSASRPRRTGRGRSRARRTSISGPSATSTFVGLMSRWTIPLAWACASPSRICAAISTLPHCRPARRPGGGRASSGRGRTRTRCRRCGCRRRTVRAQAPGCRNRAAASASRSARVPALPSRETIFSATSRPFVSSRQPDRSRAAAAERLQRPVAAEHELAGRKGRDRCRHVRFGLAGRRRVLNYCPLRGRAGRYRVADRGKAE